jgi:CRP-like cAMP-binding protein
VECGGRRETATAMEDTVVQQVPCAEFLLRLSRDALLEGFVRYLAMRIADQQRVIANLVTVDSEQRLARRSYTLPIDSASTIRAASGSSRRFPMRSWPRWSARRGRGSAHL